GRPRMGFRADDRNTRMRRRDFLRQGGVFAGSTLLLAACVPAPSSSSSPPGAPIAVAPTRTAAKGVTFQGVAMPTYMPSTTGPTPDLPSTDPNVDPGFNSYPKN